MAALVAVCWASSALALPYLPAVPKGNIAVNLRAVATGMSAPLYGFHPPGDNSRLFVLEQNGLIRILQNDVLLPGLR